MRELLYRNPARPNDALVLYTADDVRDLTLGANHAGGTARTEIALPAANPSEPRKMIESQEASLKPESSLILTNAMRPWCAKAVQAGSWRAWNEA